MELCGKPRSIINNCYKLLVRRNGLLLLLLICISIDVLTERYLKIVVTNVHLRMRNAQSAIEVLHMPFDKIHTDAMCVRKHDHADEEFVKDKCPQKLPRRLRNSEEREPAIYVMSAITSNTTFYVGFSRDIKINAWIDNKHQKKRIKCCISWIDNTISEFKDPEVIRIESTKPRIVASQIVCPFNKLLSDVDGIALQFANSSCPDPENDSYIKPYFPIKENDEEAFAVCLKVVYGNVDNTLLVDWLEYLRELKIDKIFMATYNITEATDAVIRYYVQMGFVERRHFDYPGKSEFRNLEEKTKVIWEIVRTVVYECLQRSAGYKFLSIMDFDEFLLPRKHENVKELMKYLMKKNPKAAGFRLPAYMFVKDNGTDPTVRTNGSDIVKYFKRTPEIDPKTARPKNIILPARINATRYSTHYFTPIEGYTRVNISAEDQVVTVNHYRNCYSDSRMEKYCSGRLIEDKYILKFVERIRNRTLYPNELLRKDFS